MGKGGWVGPVCTFWYECPLVVLYGIIIMAIKATIIKVLFAEMYVNVVFVIRCLYSAVSLTLVKE